MFLSDGRQLEVEFLHHWPVVRLKLSGRRKEKREMKLSNTNSLASRHIKREKALLPVDMHSSKTSLLTSLPSAAVEL